MAFKNLKEYLDNRGKLVSDPKVEEVPDYSGPQETSPPPHTKAKDAGGADKPAGKPVPYAAGKAAANPNKTVSGFGDKGDTKTTVKTGNELKVDKKNTYGSVAPNPKNPYPADPKKKQMKTEAFLDKTKNMSLTEFTQYMYQECGCKMNEEDDDLPGVTAYAAGKFQPHPPEAIRYVAALAKKNPRIMEMLVHELKSQDGLEGLLGASMDHPETFGVLTNLLGDGEEGPSRSRSLVNSMNDAYSKFNDDLYESVAPPYGMDDQMGDEGDEGGHGGNGMPRHQDDSMSDSDVDPNSDDDQAPEEDDDDLEIAPGHDQRNIDDDDNDDSDEENGQDMPHDNDDNDDNDDMDAPAPDEEAPSQPRKFKKKFAHDHVLDAMGAHDHMREKMKSYI